MCDDTLAADYQRLREVNALPHEAYRAMLSARALCVCGHARSDHAHQVAECFRCDACAMFKDQNDLDRELNEAE